MRIPLSIALALTCLALVLTTTACHPTALPGTSAGSFTVSASLTSDSCGAGFQPDSMLTYTTEIRVDGSTAYWHRGDTPLASGTYDPTGAFHFVAQQDVVAYGVDAGTGAVGCTLREIETIDGTLALGAADAGPTDAAAFDAGAADASASVDAGVHATGFTGTDTIQITIAPGSDCSLIFASSGGPFATLPCTASFTMSATAM